MSQYFVFGLYFSARPLPPTRTYSKVQAKFRSQIPVRLDLGLQILTDSDGWFYLTNVTGTANSFAVKLVYISDLEYQLRNTPVIDDEFWIANAKQQSENTNPNYFGYSVTRFEAYFPLTQLVSDVNPNPETFVAITPYVKPPFAPEFIDFAEVRLELGYDYGCVGGPGFKTEIIEVADSSESRNSTLVLPKGRWQLGERLIADSAVNQLSEVSYLVEFHALRQGAKQGFRYKDWADFKAAAQDIATGDGVKTQFQLRKAYLAGNAVTYRPIQKPVVGTVDLFVDGVNVGNTPNHGWVVNHETGVLSNLTPLANGAKLTASFEFDVPVWFETDAISLTLQAYDPDSGDNIYQLGSVFVVEGQIPYSLPWAIGQSANITTELDLGIVYETSQTREFSTAKLGLSSGFTQRSAKVKDARLMFDLGSRIYDLGELEILLGYFWNAKGSFAEFHLKNLGQTYDVRFNSDSLNIKFESASSNDAFYSIFGLKLKADFRADNLLNFLDPQTYVYIFIDTSGSMNSSIPAINSAIANLKSTLATSVYGSVEAMEQRVIQLNFSDERWLRLPTTYFQPSAVYLIWINEANSLYHGSSSYTPPTTAYLQDLNNYLAGFATREKIKLIVYSIIFGAAEFTAFQNHLVAASEGTQGYQTALKDYQLQIKLDIPQNTTAEQYYQDIIGTQSL